MKLLPMTKVKQIVQTFMCIRYFRPAPSPDLNTRTVVPYKSYNSRCAALSIGYLISLTGLRSHQLKAYPYGKVQVGLQQIRSLFFLSAPSLEF